MTLNNPLGELYPNRGSQLVIHFGHGDFNPRVIPQADSVRGVTSPELVHHVAAVNLDGPRADLKLLGDFLVCGTSAEKLEHLALARAQHRYRHSS